MSGGRPSRGPMAGSPRVLAVLSVLMGFASISTDLYLPALPTMAAALGTGAGTMELTISSYLIGFTAGQLLWCYGSAATGCCGRGR